MKQCKCPVVRGANLAIALATAIATLSQGAFAERTVSENYALSADEDWRADGIVTVPEGVTVDLAGNTLWLAGLAGAGAFTTSATGAAFTDLSGSGTASSTINGTVVQSAGNGKYPASNVFDDNGSSFFYYSGFSSQLEINCDFGVATYVNCYKILGWSNTAYQTVPKTWVFQGSNDGTTWTDLDAQADQSFVQNEEKTYVFYANNASFCKYRLKITAISSGSRLYVYEMQIGVAKNQLRFDASQAAGFAAAENTIADGIDCVLTGGTLPAEIDLRGLGRKITLEGDLDLNGRALKVAALDGSGSIATTADISDGTTPLTTTDTSTLSNVVTVRLNGTDATAGSGNNFFDNNEGNSTSLSSVSYPVDFIYDFTTPTAVNRYTITIGNVTSDSTAARRAPKNWVLYGANNKDDSTTWTPLDSREMETSGGVTYAPAADCSFDNTSPYRYYILHVTSAGNGGNRLQLNEIEYYYAGDGNYVRIEPAGLAESDLSNIDVSGDVEISASGDVTLLEATDWTAAGEVSLSGTIDLAGHDLSVAALAGDAVITNSAAYDLTVADASRVASPTTFYESNSGTAANAFSNATSGDPRVMVASANWPMVIDYDFQSTTAIDTYRLTTYTSNRSPGAWKIYGANDAAAFGSGADDLALWTEIDSRSGEEWSAAYEMHQYDFVNTQAYRYYRFRATESNSTQTYINIWKLQYGCRAQTAAVCVNVPDGATAENTGVTLAGDLRLVKEGAGTLVASKTGQPYACGTVVAAGTLTCGAEGLATPFGTGEIIAVGEDGTLEMNGKGAYEGTLIVLDGGTLQNSVTVGTGGSGSLGRLKLLADSTFDCAASTYFGNNASASAAGLIDLGGHTLDVELGTSTLRLYNTTVTNGTLNVTSGGAIISGGTYGVEARTVDFIARCKLNMAAPMTVRNYESLWTGDNADNDSALSVYGTFTPSTVHFYGATLMDGATLDLSGLLDALSIASEAAGGRTALSFEDDATIYVRLGARSLDSSSCLFSWTEETAPSNLDTLRFVRPDDMRIYRISVQSDGLYFAGAGLTIIFR